MKIRLANPSQLLVFANPSRAERARAARERAAAIRAARLNAGETLAIEPETDAEFQQAVELYEQFHGRAPEEILEAQRSDAARFDYVLLGPLLGLAPYVEGLRLPSPDHWDDGGYPVLKDFGVRLCSNAAGTQLYALGECDLADVLGEFPDVDASKDLLDLGELAYIVYDARKAPDFTPTDWMHRFDEPRPRLGWDAVKGELFFVGGRYTIDAPGIEH